MRTSFYSLALCLWACEKFIEYFLKESTNQSTCRRTYPVHQRASRIYSQCPQCHRWSWPQEEPGELFWKRICRGLQRASHICFPHLHCCGSSWPQQGQGACFWTHTYPALQRESDACSPVLSMESIAHNSVMIRPQRVVVFHFVSSSSWVVVKSHNFGCHHH